MLVSNGLGYGGAERVVQALAEDFIEAGEQVSVVATTRGGPIADQLTRAGVHVTVLGIRSSVDARVPAALAKLALARGAEVLHSHLAVSDIATAAAGLLLPGVKRISTVHNPGVELDRLKAGLWRRALTRFHRVLAVSEAVQDSLPRGLPIQVVQPSLIDPRQVHASRAQARTALGIGPDVPLVLAVGRLAPIKGFDVLARAARRLLTPGARVLVIGDGKEQARLQQLGGLTLVGARDNIEDLLPAADVIACPSRSEGFPQVPLQAMAAGLPVVATPVGGTPEIVQDDITGRLVPVENPQALAQALDTLLQTPKLAADMGQAGLHRITSAGLTRQAMSERTLSIYREVRSRWS